MVLKSCIKGFSFSIVHYNVIKIDPKEVMLIINININININIHINIHIFE